MRKKNKKLLQLTVKLLEVAIYPSGRNAFKTKGPIRAHFLPPLMVRKPAWRK